MTFVSWQTRQPIKTTIALKQTGRNAKRPWSQCTNNKLHLHYILYHYHHPSSLTDTVKHGLTLIPDSPGIPRAPSAPARPWNNTKTVNKQNTVQYNENQCDKCWKWWLLTRLPDLPGGPDKPWGPLGPWGINCQVWWGYTHTLTIPKRKIKLQ